MTYRRLAAFTLLELLTAFVILTVFLGSVFAIYRTAQASIARTKDQQEVYQTARVLLAQLTTELTSAYQPASAKMSALSGTVANDPTTNLPQQTLQFITTAHPAPASQPAGDLCQVTYEISGDGSPASPTGLYLIEDFHPGLEVASETLTARLVSPRVVGLTCFYLDSAGTWNSTWDATTQTTLPVAVRVELTLKTRGTGSNPVVFSATANLLTATAPASGTTGTMPTGGSNAATP